MELAELHPPPEKRFKQIAKDLNYVPHFAARALKTGRTGIIAILSGSLSEPYYANMVELLERPYSRRWVPPHADTHARGSQSLSQ